MQEPKPNGRNPMGLQQLLDHEPPQPDTLESLAANYETLRRGVRHSERFSQPTAQVADLDQC